MGSLQMPKLPRGTPNMAQREPKRAQGRPHGAPSDAQVAPRRPKGSRGTPKGAQGHPKGAKAPSHGRGVPRPRPRPPVSEDSFYISKLPINRKAAVMLLIYMAVSQKVRSRRIEFDPKNYLVILINISYLRYCCSERNGTYEKSVQLRGPPTWNAWELAGTHENVTIKRGRLR